MIVFVCACVRCFNFFLDIFRGEYLVFDHTFLRRFISGVQFGRGFRVSSICLPFSVEGYSHLVWRRASIGAVFMLLS